MRASQPPDETKVPELRKERGAGRVGTYLCVQDVGSHPVRSLALKETRAKRARGKGGTDSATFSTTRSLSRVSPAFPRFCGPSLLHTSQSWLPTTRAGSRSNRWSLFHCRPRPPRLASLGAQADPPAFDRFSTATQTVSTAGPLHSDSTHPPRTATGSPTSGGSTPNSSSLSSNPSRPS